MASKAIQVSVTQVAAGIVLGAGIEAVLPKRTEDASLTNQVFEALVQVGLNGAALAMFAGIVRGAGEDPTYGIPFVQALSASQPELQKRLGALSAVVASQVRGVSRQMAAQIATA